MVRSALISLTVLLAATAGAETLERAERPCHAELLRGARAACLSYLFEQRDARLEAQIASTLAGLQAARPDRLRALAMQYRTAQAAWRAAVAEGCADEDAVLAERCRLGAVLARAEQVSESLARASADLGGPAKPDLAVPEAVEVLIPLELPSGAGDATARLPLWVPVLP